ncbi:large ribosomal subunit protein bL9m [Culicoides brevitarsis]|uniref:large ribosomal subunit protein bL9m n=1 Tax=Culicoides brevitarsis TaxID=469753 RepID=UPI00307C20F3
MLRNSLNLVKSSFFQQPAVVTACFLPQTRNTFILKRRWEPKLHKKNEKPAKLRGRHFVYDFVEDTTVKPRYLKLILSSFVEGMGQKGDIVTVKHDVGYNKLLLPGLAVYHTPENLKKYERTAESIAEEALKHSTPYAERTVNILQSLTFFLSMNKDHPWTIEKWHIRTTFRKMQIYVPDECIEMPKEPITGPDMEKEHKEFYVTVTINNLEKARARFRIHHWSSEPSERLPYIYEFWKKPSELLFPDDETQRPLAK